MYEGREGERGKWKKVVRKEHNDVGEQRVG